MGRYLCKRKVPNFVVDFPFTSDMFLIKSSGAKHTRCVFPYKLEIQNFTGLFLYNFEIFEHVFIDKESSIISAFSQGHVYRECTRGECALFTCTLFKNVDLSSSTTQRNNPI